MASIIFLNYRGARKNNMGKYLWHIVSFNEVVFIGIIETEIKEIIQSDVDRLISSGWEVFCCLSRGKIGWLLTLAICELV